MCDTMREMSVSGGVRKSPIRLSARPNDSWANSAESGIEKTSPTVTGSIHKKKTGWMR